MNAPLNPISPIGSNFVGIPPSCTTTWLEVRDALHHTWCCETARSLRATNHQQQTVARIRLLLITWGYWNTIVKGLTTSDIYEISDTHLHKQRRFRALEVAQIGISWNSALGFKVRYWQPSYMVHKLFGRVGKAGFNEANEFDWSTWWRSISAYIRNAERVRQKASTLSNMSNCQKPPVSGRFPNSQKFPKSRTKIAVCQTAFFPLLPMVSLAVVEGKPIAPTL